MKLLVIIFAVVAAINAAPQFGGFPLEGSANGMASSQNFKQGNHGFINNAEASSQNGNQGYDLSGSSNTAVASSQNGFGGFSSAGKK
jgi:hypothetical protein